MRVAEGVAEDRAGDRAERPGDVLREGGAEQEPPVEGAVPAVGEGPRGVDDGLPLGRPLQRPPGNEGASATPMARNRAFIRLAAVSAAEMPPPTVTTDSMANWAEPAKTITEVVAACATLNPACLARTPKERLSRKPTAAKGTPSLRPCRNAARGLSSLAAVTAAV